MRTLGSRNLPAVGKDNRRQNWMQPNREKRNLFSSVEVVQTKKHERKTVDEVHNSSVAAASERDGFQIL